MISPVSVSSAAPTLKCEKSATACSRAARAAATSVSEALNNTLEQRDELPLHLLGGLHHFRVMERLGKNACGGVGNAGDAEHFHLHVTGGNGFRRGRHAHS